MQERSLVELATDAQKSAVADAKLDVAVQDIASNANERDYLSPPGALGLPALLDERRIQYAIIDRAFSIAAAFDRVLLWHIDPAYAEGDTFAKGSSILRPDSVKSRMKNEAPRGVIVSAGLKALDNLRSNGIDLGHVVNFIRMNPWQIPIDIIGGIQVGLMVMRDGDILASEDLQAEILSKRVRVSFDATHNQHVLTDSTGRRWNPTMPWMPDEY